MKLQVFIVEKYLKKLDSALNKDENCYPQVFLKKCRYIEKEKKLDIFLRLNFISDYSDDPD